MTRFSVYALCLAMSCLAGCRGQTSEKPPIHLNPNMDTQEKYKAQSRSHFFADGRTMRTPVQGTVARGFLKEDDAMYRGKVDGVFVTTPPLEVNEALVQRGQDRYNIFCAPCHDSAGTGKGLVALRGLVPPPSYHDERIRQMPDGQLFDLITNGVRTMPSYRHQIPDETDRWAIVTYIRALQRGQNATSQDVPVQEGKAVQ